jgi:uncharacterized protein (DUF2141 family)
MLRNRLIVCITGLALIMPGLAWSALPSLTVHVINVKDGGGAIEVSLFNSVDTFLKQVYLQQSGTASDSGEFTAEFAALEAGEYAVVVVHDENGNETFDSGFLGFGAEGLGYSNNVRPWFFRPTFDEVKIQIDSVPTSIEISLE